MYIKRPWGGVFHVAQRFEHLLDVLDRDPSDLYRLDADNNGIACETYPYDDDGGSADDGHYSSKTPPSDVSNSNDIVPNTTVKKMPNTGGPPYLVFGAALLLGAALVAVRGILRL